MFHSFLYLFVPEDSIELPITPAFALQGYLHTPAFIIWSDQSRPGYLLPASKVNHPFHQKQKVRGLIATNCSSLVDKISNNLCIHNI